MEERNIPQSSLEQFEKKVKSMFFKFYYAMLYYQKNLSLFYLITVLIEFLQISALILFNINNNSNITELNTSKIYFLIFQKTKTVQF
jgi:hypothetical protein